MLLFRQDTGSGYHPWFSSGDVWTCEQQRCG